jgi:hypothetical protein
MWQRTKKILVDFYIIIEQCVGCCGMRQGESGGDF